MKTIKFYYQTITAICCTIMLVALAACNKNEAPGDEPDDPNNPKTEQRAFGWNKSTEDFTKYPRDVTYKFSSTNSNSLPAKVDLSDKLPPVGNQGNYGTCVSWAVGYGLRTYMNAVSRGLSKQQLTDKSKQFSPADLWMATGAAGKGQGCEGSHFDYALNVLVTRGITTLQNAPYQSINCDGQPPQAWTNDAANYKISNYRMIDQSDWTVNNFKTQLSQGKAVVIGARLGDNFMAWKNDGVLNSETYLQPNMQHAYHAILLVGYDNNKGANGAFRIFNSWDTDWGDKGYIWVDYNFFINYFINAAFVATPENDVNPNDNNEIDPNNLCSGLDIAANDVIDVSYYNPNVAYANREVRFNVFNAGTSPVNSSSRWSVVYMYYNAFNASDYGILMHLYYTNEVQGAITFNQAGLPLPEGGTGYCINQNIPAGKNISAVFFNEPSYTHIYIPYRMPSLNGFYYLILFADPFDVLQEVNEQNNFTCIDDGYGYPLLYQNGQTYGTAKTRAAGEAVNLGGGKVLRSPVSEQAPNAYSPQEIQKMLIDVRNSGKLERMLKDFDGKQVSLKDLRGK